MIPFRIKFSNTHTFILHGFNRKEVLEKAIRTTRGLLTEAQQKANLKICIPISS